MTTLIGHEKPKHTSITVSKISSSFVKFSEENFEEVTNPKFEIYTDKAGEFRFRLKARNGEIILSSEGYKAKASCENGKTELQNAIIKGLREKAATLTKQLLETNEPLDIVQREIIPSLDIIGKGFEEKTVYLPGLLISAEAAKYAFEEIKSFVTEKGGESVKKCDFVLATVRGDVHDIGKNIVKLLLENYGFNVIDLGKDVPPEAVAEAAERTGAPFVGLSALMTTTVPAMEETIKLLRVRAPYAKIIVGGPMMGFALFDLDVPTTKSSSALLCVSHDEVADAEETACINCGRCVEVCPGRVIPSRLADLAQNNRKEEFEKMNGMECCECGCCSYICPAKRHLTQSIKSMRRTILADRRKK